MAVGDGQAADDFSEPLINNTVHVSVYRGDEIRARGSGIVLGMVGERATLLTAAHVIYRPGEIGRGNSEFSLRLEAASFSVEVNFSDAAIYPGRGILAEALLKDFIVVSIPVDPHTRHRILDLGDGNFAPPREAAIAVAGRTRYGNIAINYGRIIGHDDEDTVSFDFKTEDFVERGESGSPIYTGLGVISGVLVSTTGKTSQGVYPAEVIDEAIEEIALASLEREYFVGWSLSLNPTFQIANDVTRGEDDSSITRQEQSSYTSLDLEMLGARSIKGELETPKLGLVFGVSDGEGHALGKVEDVDYTLKAGVTLGIASFSEKWSFSLGLLVLAHSVDEAFEYELATSIEMIPLSWKVTSSTSLDVGMRFEFNELDIDALDDIETSAGIGLVVKYSWLGKY